MNRCWRIGAGFAATVLLAVGAAAAAPDRPVTIALGGDMIGPFQLSPSGAAAARGVFDMFRAADVGIANQEGSIFDAASFAGYAASENGGGYPLAPAVIAPLLRTLGITAVSKANNHATDFGTLGLMSTLRTLDAAGIAHAGAGLDRAAACAPRYVTAGPRTVALISAASTFPPMARAEAPVTVRGGRQLARPGICAIAVRNVELVSAATLARLRQAAGDAAIDGSGPGEEVRIGDVVFRPGAHPGHIEEADPGDVATVLAAVRAAHASGAIVILAVHAHETHGQHYALPPAAFEPLLLNRANEAPSADDPRPAAFEPLLFHAAVDAGADIVFRTGPHAVLPMETYRGRPIFYGLGSLFFGFGGKRSYTAQNGQQMRLPDAWFRSVVASVTIPANGRARVVLHPITLISSPGSDDGWPVLHDQESGRR